MTWYLCSCIHPPPIDSCHSFTAKSFSMATRQPDRAAQWGPPLTFSVDISDVFKVHQQRSNPLLQRRDEYRKITNLYLSWQRLQQLDMQQELSHSLHFGTNRSVFAEAFQWDAVQVARRPRTAVCLTIDHNVNCCPSLPWFCPWI